MVEEIYISKVFEDLNLRYNRISVVTNKQRLKRGHKIQPIDADFKSDMTLPPSLEEAEEAFRNYNCAIFTAFRGGFTLDENIKRNLRLKQDLIVAGLEFRPVDGCYREADMEFPVKEYCFFVPKAQNMDAIEFFNEVFRLAEKYEQECFLYKRAGVNKTAFLVATSDDGRAYCPGGILYTGQFFKYVYDVGSWTDCRDGRFAFQVKGMILINTGNKKVKLGEGDVFDTEGYNADGIIVITKEDQSDIINNIKNHTSTPIAKHIFKNENQSEEAIHNALIRAFKVMKDNKCKRIGIYCSAMIDGSFTNGAQVAYSTITAWSARNPKKHEWIVIADKFGDYSKVLNDRI